MKKCIIFDMDGVLVNTEPLHFQLWQQVFQEKGLLIDYEHYKGCTGSTKQYLFALIRDFYGVDFSHDPDIPKRFVQLKVAYLKEHGIPEIPGVPEVIQYLQEGGYLLAVASSSPQDMIEWFMEQLGIAPYFRILFSAERVKRPKPAPDVFLHVSERLGILPRDCIVVEDSHNGVRAARAAGMHCIEIQNPDSGEQDLTAADRICSCFAELKNIL